MAWSTLLSVAKQVARLVPSPSERLRNRKRPSFAIPGERCGCCPVCRDFVRIDQPEEAGVAACPSCGAWVDRLDPLGEQPTGTEVAASNRRGPEPFDGLTRMSTPDR